MLTIPQYLLESSFCLLIFYGFYALFLRKETFFQLNRAYLVLTPALSLSIPLLNISFQKDAPAESFEAFLYPAIQSANNINDLVWEQMRAPSPVFSLSVADVLMAVYLIGVFLMAFTLLRGLWNLTRIISRGKRSKNNEFTLVETQNNFPAASFFGYIFWNQQITDEQKLILEHEKVHIRQWHSLDVLLMEFCVIIKWFNPLIYWFRNALRATHEYIADQYVIQQKSNVQDYATLLVNQQKSLTPSPLTNTFYSLTTKRLKMMLQRPSNKAYAIKYLMIVPMVSALMLLFSFNLLEEIPRVSEGLSEMNEAISDLTETTVFEIDEEFDNSLIANLVETEDEQLATLGKKEEKYQLFWGETEIPATYHNSEDVPITTYDIELKEFVKLVRHPITLKKSGKIFIPNKLYLSIYGKDIIVPMFKYGENFGTIDYIKDLPFNGQNEDLKVGDAITYEKPEYTPLKIELEGSNKMTFSEKDYERIFNLIDGKVTVNIKSMDNHVITSSIHVFTPNSKYSPPHKINREEKEVFNFQLLSPLNGRSILKIDTIKSARIAKGFRDKSKYKIIHIPNFQTYERVLDEKTLKGNKTPNTGNVIYNSITDADLLPNLIVESPTDLQLNWGDLTAALESENLALKEFYQNISKTPQLLYQGKKMPFEKIRMTIIREGLVYTKSFAAADFGAKKMAEILNKVENKTSIYFDKIEIKDNGVTKHLQQRFLFKVGNQVLKSSFEKAEKTPKYQMKWGHLDLPIILNDKTNSTVAHFMTVADFKKNIDNPFRLIKSGNRMKDKSLEITFFDKESDNNWGIDKLKGNKNEYWETLTSNYQHFKIDGRTKKHFTKEELSLIKNLAQEGWLMTIRSADNYLLYSSISLVAPTSVLLQIDPDHWKKNDYSVQIRERYPRDNRVDFKKVKVETDKRDSTDIMEVTLYPFSYSNQMVISKKKMKKADGSERFSFIHDMKDYELVNSDHLSGEEAIAEFGEAGRKGIFSREYRHKKRKARKKVNTQNKPLILYYFHPSFPMLTHKLIYKDLKASDIKSTITHLPGSKKAKLYGALGKNGITEIWFVNNNPSSLSEKTPVKIKIEKANPVWSKHSWLTNDSLYGVYLFQNMSLAEVYKVLKQVPDNQLDFSELKNDFPMRVSVHGTLKKHQNEEWILEKIKEEFPYEVKEKKALRKVLVLKKGSTSSMSKYEYFDKVLPNIKSVIRNNQKENLKTVTPGYIKDYQKVIRETFELPLIDETGYFENNAICLGLNLSSIPYLQEQLRNKYGLELTVEKREIPIYSVIRK